MLEAGVSAWVNSRHLERLVLEVWDPKNAQQLIGRFDFTIDYSYYGSGDGDLWLDPDTVAWAIRKNGSYPSSCDYRVVADTVKSHVRRILAKLQARNRTHAVARALRLGVLSIDAPGL